MNNQNFAAKLRSERDRLHLTQEEVADMLNMTQSAYSRIENSVVSPSADRLQEITNRLKAKGFAELPPVELEEIAGKAAIVIRWPWNKYVLYAILFVLAIIVTDYVIHGASDFARGFSDGYAGKAR